MLVNKLLNNRYAEHPDALRITKEDMRLQLSEFWWFSRFGSLIYPGYQVHVNGANGPILSVHTTKVSDIEVQAATFPFHVHSFQLH